MLNEVKAKLSKKRSLLECNTNTSFSKDDLLIERNQNFAMDIVIDLEHLQINICTIAYFNKFQVHLCCLQNIINFFSEHFQGKSFVKFLFEYCFSVYPCTLG